MCCNHIRCSIRNELHELLRGILSSQPRGLDMHALLRRCLLARRCEFMLELRGWNLSAKLRYIGLLELSFWKLFSNYGRHRLYILCERHISGKHGANFVHELQCYQLLRYNWTCDRHWFLCCRHVFRYDSECMCKLHCRYLFFGCGFLMH